MDDKRAFAEEGFAAELPSAHKGSHSLKVWHVSVKRLAIRSNGRLGLIHTGDAAVVGAVFFFFFFDGKLFFHTRLAGLEGPFGIGLDLATLAHRL